MSASQGVELRRDEVLGSDSGEWPSPPVAPAVIVGSSSEAGSGHRVPSAGYSYPVATFVQNLVRSSMDHITELRQPPARDEVTMPISIRSETDLDNLVHSVSSEFAHERMLSASAINDSFGDIIIVDGDLVAVPPPPNRIEQDVLETESRIRASGSKSCHRGRMHRGVKRLSKLFKRKSHSGQSAGTPRDGVGSIVSELSCTTNSSFNNTNGSLTSALTGIDPLAPMGPGTHSPRRRSNRQRQLSKTKHKSWRRSDSGGTGLSDEERPNETDVSGATIPALTGFAASSDLAATPHDSLINRFSTPHDVLALLPIPSPASMTPIREAASSLGSGSSRTASVTAELLGTEDQVLEAGVMPNHMPAEAFIEFDDKKDDSTLVPSLVPADADYKVDKADAPDVESMLLRAANETTMDLEAADHLSPPIRRRAKGKSDGTSVPLSQACVSDEVVHNDMLKLVMVASPEVDKSWVARSIRNCQKRPRKRVTIGVEVHSWTPVENENPVKCLIWDVQGATGCSETNPNFGAHPGTQSLFFSEKSLYLLVWDLACTNFKTYRRESMEEGENDDSDDEDATDEFLREEHNRQADRALQADVAQRVLSWVDCIERSGPESAILPVALIPEGMPDKEVKRRCEMMQNMLEDHIRRSRTNPVATKLLSGTDNIMRINQVDGVGIEELREMIHAIATDTSRSVFSHVGTSVPPRTVQVLEAIRRFKQDHKLISLDHLVGDLGTTISIDEIETVLRFLSSIGEILHFGTAGIDDVRGKDDVLSRYIVLSRKWLVSALSCILRNDLKRELSETRRFMNMQCIYSDQEFLENRVINILLGGSTSSCPLLSDADAKMLWQSMSFMREAADAYSQLEESSTTAPTMFYFLERLLVAKGIFLPLKTSTQASLHSSDVFFVPSLLAQGEPKDTWTFKNGRGWLASLCNSWLFRDGAPSNLMEQLTVGLLGDLYEFCRESEGALRKPCLPQRAHTVPKRCSSLHDFVQDHQIDAVGQIRIHQIHCWKSSVVVKIGMVFADEETGELRESFVEIYVAVVDQSSSTCVAADAMRAGMQRVVVCGKGQVGNHGQKLWKGGYKVVIESIRRSLSRYANVDAQVVCPECLAHADPRHASTWSFDSIMAAAGGGNTVIRCMHGHRVDSNLICGACESRSNAPVLGTETSSRLARPVPDMLSSVVLVGLWDPISKEIRNVGSGFIADRKHGLVVTAGHVLFNMAEGNQFGSPYYGLKDAKVVIGVIPDGCHNAVFRYFADIIADDIQNVDACVLQIRTKMENDVDNEGSGCADQAEIVLNFDSIQEEKLRALKITTQFELDETVRVLGFNQGGEGVLEKGKHINRSADFARGYICKKFIANATSDDSSCSSSSSHMNFSPREEIVIICPTISGHSGGPCVNNEGKVVGILSRADPSERQRCYLVTGEELKRLLMRAKKRCTRPTPLSSMHPL